MKQGVGCFVYAMTITAVTYHGWLLSQVNKATHRHDSFKDMGFTMITNATPTVIECTSNHPRKDAPATTGITFSMAEKIRRYKPLNISDEHVTAFPVDSFPIRDQWAVVTTIFNSTKLIQTLMTMTDWCTVVIADTKSVKKQEYLDQLELLNESCIVYLTTQDQIALGYSILDYIQFNSFGRKNIGYIFAMQHGARVIYDTDDDNEIADVGLLQYWALQKWSLGFNAVFNWVSLGSNPYPTFGAENVWPRGLPLHEIKNTMSSESHPETNEIEKENMCVIQSLANQEPDVDAIYRLTNPKYPLSFASGKLLAGTVRVKEMAPFNAQATLFFKEAFPLMLLPVTVHGRVSDIWRSYMAQALMKCKLVFSSPWVTQIRNSHDYMADFQAELPLYMQTQAFVEFLQSLTGVHIQLHDIVVEAYEYGILEENDVKLVMAWQRDMKRAEYSAQLFSVPTQMVRPGFKHLFIAMGRGHHLRAWKDIVLKDRRLHHMNMVLGVFDEPVETLGCEYGARMQCVSVQGYTWTTGRNKLAQTAFKMEAEYDMEHTYWTFADADIILHCLEGYSQLLIPSEECFINYDIFLQESRWPVVSTAAVGMSEPLLDHVMIEIEAFDASWNSFHRHAIPILLPYRPEQDFNTWWSSQAIFWYRVRCLYPNYSMIPLSIFYANPEHNPYPRNIRNSVEEISLGQELMGGLASVLGNAPMDYTGQFTKEKIRLLSDVSNPPWMHTDGYSLCVREFAQGHLRFVTEGL